MKRNSPMMTLLVGIGLAAVLFLLSMHATEAGRTAGEQAGPTAVPGVRSPSAPAPLPSSPSAPSTPFTDPPVNKVPLAAPVPITATWAGDLQLGSLAVSAKNGTAIGYLCDGKRIEAWLKGTAAGGRLALSGAKGATLTGTFAKGKARGTVRAGGRTYAFSISIVNKPSGLYRSVSNVRGAKVIGGWIVLADGSQVGLGTVDGTLRATSPLDLVWGSATIDGTSVTATRAEGVQ